MRRIYLNDGWTFYPSWSNACIRTTVAAEGEKVRIPHTAAILPYNYQDEEDYQRICGYVRMLSVPEDFSGKELWLTFEGIAHKAEVFINGKSAASHFCGYTAFSVNIAPYVHFGCENRIAVKVDSHEQQAPFHGGIDNALIYGGIYRDVYVEVKKPSHIEDIFIRTKNGYEARCERTAGSRRMEKPVLHGGSHMALSVRLSRGACKENKVIEGGGYIQVSVFDGMDNCLCVKKQRLSRFFGSGGSSFETNKSRTATVRMNFEQVFYWDVDQPCLYFAEVLLWSGRGEILDSSRVSFGFRDIQFRQDGFYLNGRKLKLIGLNRHQSFPYVGYAVPESMQRLDAELLKNELGVNVVRTAHCTPSRHFINRCDELGLLVFMEPAGGKTAGNGQSAIVNNVRDMIAQYRNHPSIIFWELGENEEDSEDALYIKTDRIARRMDPTRVSGNSAGAYGVSKKAGCTYPAKMFDDETRRLEHAMRHARVLENVFGSDTAAGSLGWCMSDYQTRRGAGSGDGICYHGVMDMFRNMKPAGWLYASQGRENVCMLSSNMAPGDYEAGRPGSLWVFTNCDYVRAFREGSFLGEFFPDQSRFRHLPHPPVEIPAHILYGDRLQQGNGIFRFEFIKNGRLIQRILRRPASKAYLDVLCSHTCLVERDSYDMALLRIHAVDAQGLLLPYYNEPVRIKVSGPIALVGPDTISLKGGCFGTFVRTLGGKGNAKVTLFACGMEPVEVYMNVRKEPAKSS